MMKPQGTLLFLMLLFGATTVSAQYLHQPGDPAPDFEGITVDGRAYHLYESQAEGIVLCFWSVDCDYCHDFLRQLRRHAGLIAGFELVTFALADNERQVKRQFRCRRLRGWHFFDESGWDSAPFLDYDVNNTPTLVLIDRDKNIVGEAYDWDEFQELIQNYGE